jgi:hypothetical protein
MRCFTLIRKETSDQGTFGIFVGDGIQFHSAELPWRDNSPQLSCIPAGRYTCRPYSSPKFPNVYEVTGVPGRSAILIHSGNYAGDTDKGFLSDVLGCILLGLGLGEILKQKVVVSSRLAMDRLRAVAGRESFELVITDETGAAG